MLVVTGIGLKGAHTRWLEEMFKHRKAVFIDRLGWSLTETQGGERDDYDGPDAVYLLSLRDTILVSSVRLLPTTKPHLMADHFAALCPGGVPKGPTIWEASRFCINPQITDPNQKHEELGRIIAGVMSTGLAMGIAHISFIAGSALLPLALQAGWDVRILGPQLNDGADKVTAVLADITPAGLQHIKGRLLAIKNKRQTGQSAVA